MQNSGPWPAENILDALEGVSYCARFDGTIIAVGRSNWDAFIAENTAPQTLIAAAMPGRNLFDFISGDDVQVAYRQMLDDLRQRRNRHISFTFRCDAPELRRDMRMCMSCICENAQPAAVLFQSLTLDERQRPPVSLFDAERMRALWESERSLPIVTMCSFCHDVRWPSDSETWVAPEGYYAAGGSSRVQLSHGICPKCHADKGIRREWGLPD